MSSPTVLDCRGMQLLKLDGTPEEESFVSVHQLSLYLWELFKVPRGSVQKKISDLGFTIYGCTKEGVQLLRDQSVITAYKASQVTLSDAERVYDAIQLSRQRREVNERKKQEHADRRWLQKVGSRRQEVMTNEDSGQVEKLKGVEQTEVEECALYKVSSPPTNVASESKVEGPSMSEDNRVSLDCKDGVPNGGEVLKRNTIVLKRTTTTNGHSMWIGKKESSMKFKKHKKHKTESEIHDIENSIQRRRIKRSSSLSEQQILVPSALSNGSEEVFAPDASNRDISQGSVSDEAEELSSEKHEVDHELNGDGGSQALGCADNTDNNCATALSNKRIVKLRVFAQNSSPKVKSTLSKPPYPSAGKRFPSTSEKSPKVSRKPMIVSIPRSLLTEGCNKDFSSGKCYSSEQAPSTTTLICSPSSSFTAGQKKLRNYKGKAKETALCTFASKKRASTRTPPPVESFVAKQPRFCPGASLDRSVSPSMSPVSPFTVQSGAEVNILSKYLSSRPCRSRKSTISSSSCSPQPGCSTPVVECQPSRGISNDPGPSHLPSDNPRSSKLETSRNNSIDQAAHSDVKDQSSAKQSQTLQKGHKAQVPTSSGKDEGFCFRKFFDSVPCKLVVRDGELCPAVSLSLKGVKSSDIPPDHPIWTWKVGQPTKKAPPVVKWRTTRQKNSKSKIQLIS